MSDPVCSICFDPIHFSSSHPTSSFKEENIALNGASLSTEMKPLITKCDHVFHHSCLKGWIDTLIANGTQKATCCVCSRELCQLRAQVHASSQGVAQEPDICERAFKIIDIALISSSCVSGTVFLCLVVYCWFSTAPIVVQP